MRIWLSLVILAACGSDPDPLTIDLDSGTIHGEGSGDIREFLGIPYAAPPVGDFRFRAPQPVTPWTTTMETVAFGPECPQSLSLSGVSNTEDCLYLNVWAPQGASNMPVMVWLHGGAFILGSGGDKYYDGSNLASQGVIVVSLNYRLGLFGFLANSAFANDDPDYPTIGNYGLEDQRAALQWVQRNIEKFGGDPKHVTLFGESAGGMSVCIHYLSSRTAGLFDRAISESGLCSSPLLEVQSNIAATEGDMIATSLGCADHDATTVDCLRGKTADELLAVTKLPAPTDPPGGPIYQPFLLPGSLPVVDGYVIEQPLAAAVKAGNFQPRPLILGNVADEGTLFHSPLFAQPVTDDASYRAALGNRFDAALIDGIVGHYPVDAYPTPNRTLAQVTGDAFFKCPSRVFAAAVTTAGAALYRYQWETEMTNPLFTDLGVFHSSEIPFVFGNDDYPLGQIGPATDMATAIQAYWIAFAKTANPNVTGQLAWPLYDSTNPQIEFSSPLKVGTHLDDDACVFWTQEVN
ncbi:MAG: carboxylesterase family protein [Kofleriaceae bacterium]